MGIRPQYVDISQFNLPASSIDWATYHAWAAQWDGVARLALRVTEGTSVLDGHFAEYRAAATLAGIEKLLFYHFADPDLNSAKAEFAWFAHNLGPIRLEDEVMLDAEKDVAAFTSEWALAWYEEGKRTYGRDASLYASPSFIASHFTDPRIAAMPLVLADWQYDAAEIPHAPSPWADYLSLQYSDQARVPGFGTTPVDADVSVLGAYGHRSPGTVVAHLQQSYQLEQDETQDACGPWSVAELLFAGQISPSGTAEQIDIWADVEYTQYVGPNTTADQAGSTLDDMRAYLHDATHVSGSAIVGFQEIAGINAHSVQPSDLANVHAALDAGYPLLVWVLENSVLERGGTSPYSWNTAGLLHTCTLVGYSGDGYLLVDDTLNSQDAWPNQYREATIALQWAAVVQLDWLPPIQAGDPKGWIRGMIPQGWTDTLVGGDAQLKNPTNGFIVRGALRETVLTWAGGWEGWNVPVEQEHAAQHVEMSNQKLGAGIVQAFRARRLEMLAAQQNKVISGWTGQELVWYQLVALPQAQAQLATAAAQVATDAATIANLQAELAACQTTQGGIPPGLLQALSDAQAQLQVVSSETKDAATKADAVEQELAPYISRK